MQFQLEALKNFFRKPSTEKYPIERREPPEGSEVDLYGLWRNVLDAGYVLEYAQSKP